MYLNVKGGEVSLLLEDIHATTPASLRLLAARGHTLTHRSVGDTVPVDSYGEFLYDNIILLASGASSKWDMVHVFPAASCIASWTHVSRAALLSLQPPPDTDSHTLLSPLQALEGSPRLH